MMNKEIRVQKKKVYKLNKINISRKRKRKGDDKMLTLY